MRSPSLTCCLAAAVLFGTMATSAIPAQAQQVTVQSGMGSARGIVSRPLSTLPQLPSTGAVQTRTVPLGTGADPLTYAARKSDAASKRFALPKNPSISGPPAAPGSLAPTQTPTLTPGTSLTATSVKQADCGGWDPADQALAVGDTPVGVVQVVNECVVVLDKNGVIQAGYPKSLNGFFGQNGCGIGIFDPRAIYDWINHRYIILGVDKCSAALPTSGSYWLAVSTGDNPVGTYCIYQLGVQSDAVSDRPFPDFPRLGQDRQGIYLASNIFSQVTNSYKFEEILALPKANLYACQNIGFQFFFQLNVGGVFTDTTQPADTYNPGDDPREMYFVTSKNIRFGGGQCSSPCNGLVVWGLYGVIGSQTLTGVVVGTANNYLLPPNASQPGSANSIDTGDTRLSGSAAYSSGSIYASLNSNNGAGGAVCILYEIKPFVNTNGTMASATILNELVLNYGGTSSAWFCTQQPDPEGNVTHVFNYSTTGTFASLVYGSRRSAQPRGTFPDSGVFLVVGQGLNTGGRWGDYTATAAAGLVSGGGTGGFPTFWFSGMFARSDNSWQTAIGRNGYNAVTQP